MPRLPLLSLAALLLWAMPAHAQGDLAFETFKQFTDSLSAIASIPDAAERDAAMDVFWDALVDAERVPFALGDSVAYLYRGSGTTVRLAGDHNGWNPNAESPLLYVGQSDVQWRIRQFPEAARLEYKFVRDGSWILDPVNPHQQWGGFGPNSELRMPAWVFPEETVRYPDVPLGAFTSNRTLASTNLGYSINYRVYTPAGYDNLADLPVIYVTDGHEYSDDRLGAFRIVLDNLIDDGRSESVIVVFIDPRVNGQNLRADQYVQNPDFAAFIAEELVPVIDAAYRTRTDRDSRVILGTSLGGLFSTYLGLQHPDVFGKLAIQSPAFWVSESPDWWTGTSIYDLMADAENGLFDIYMSTGNIRDTEDGARRMRDLFEATDQSLVYHEVAESHTWGNWRALLDEVLIALVPGKATDAEDAQGALPSLRLSPYPNPATERLTFHFALGAPASTRLACYDVGGRLRARLVDGEVLAAGEHIVSVHTRRLGAAGAYLCRLTIGERTATRLVSVL